MNEQRAGLIRYRLERAIETLKEARYLAEGGFVQQAGRTLRRVVAPRFTGSDPIILRAEIACMHAVKAL